MTDNDLHSRLVAALQARLDVARAATVLAGQGASHAWIDDEGRLRLQGADVAVTAEATAHIAANAPDVEIRRVEAMLRVVERHRPYPHPYRAGIVQCDHCAAQCHSRSGLACDSPADAIFPCDDIRDLAAGEGIEP